MFLMLSLRLTWIVQELTETKLAHDMKLFSSGIVNRTITLRLLVISSFTMGGESGEPPPPLAGMDSMTTASCSIKSGSLHIRLTPTVRCQRGRMCAISEHRSRHGEWPLKRSGRGRSWLRLTQCKQQTHAALRTSFCWPSKCVRGWDNELRLNKQCFSGYAIKLIRNATRGMRCGLNHPGSRTVLATDA